MESMAGKSKTLRTIISIIFFGIFILYVIPFVIVFINALKSNRDILANPFSIATNMSFDNIVMAFNAMDFPRSMWNTLLITIFSVLILTIISSMAAYLFVRTDWLACKVVFTMMIVSMIVPFQALMIPLVIIYGNELHILSSRATLIFMYQGFGATLTTFIYHGFIRTSIPEQLEEAALLDGCGRLKTFVLIVFPLLKPITATAAVLNVLWIWNDFLLPSLVLNTKNLYTLPLSTYSFYGTYTVNYGAIMAALLLTVVPVIAVYVFLQKYIISGVISGAVKG